MLLFSLHEIGNQLFKFRKKAGLTQEELAEIAGIADRTYADIERGTVNMRLITLLRICNALKVTPDEILTRQEADASTNQQELWERLAQCSVKDRETALQLLSVFLRSIPE